MLPCSCDMRELQGYGQVEAASGNKLTQADDKGFLEFFLLRR